MTVTHRQSKTRLYSIWINMKARCKGDPNRADYLYYAWRGISVCEEWTSSYVTFRDWALSNGYLPDLEIDRKDVNGNYQPSNCRWVTRIENVNNCRSNRFVTIDGVTLSVAQWCREKNVHKQTVWHRIRKGWPEERWFEPPNKPKGM